MGIFSAISGKLSGLFAQTAAEDVGHPYPPIIIPPAAPPVDLFQQCLSFTLAQEGGLSMDQNDPGNWTGGQVGHGILRGTNFGISAAAYPDEDIANLTRDGAAAIYQRDYWAPSHCAELPAGVNLPVFDFAVNAGVRRSITALQNAAVVQADGVVGPATLAAVAKMPPSGLITIITAAHERFYDTMKDAARYATALDGRAGRCKAAALAMLTT